MAESSSGAVGGNTMSYSQFKKSRQSLKGEPSKQFSSCQLAVLDKVQQEQDARKEEFVQHGKHFKLKSKSKPNQNNNICL